MGVTTYIARYAFYPIKGYKTCLRKTFRLIFIFSALVHYA